MRDRSDAAARPHPGEERAVADPGCAENDVLAVGKIIGGKDAVEIFPVTVGDQVLSFLLVARPHSALHVATEAFDRRRRQYRFGRTADAHVKIHILLR